MRITKKYFFLFICLIILLIFPESSEAEKLKVKVVVDNTSIRLKPDIGSMIIETVSLGAVLESEEQVEEWYKVSLPPDESGYVVMGYIHSSAVKIVKEIEVEEVPAEMSPVSPAIEPKKPSPPPTYQPAPGSGVEFGFKLSGGMAYLSVGDLNTGFQGYNDYLNEFPEEDVEGKYNLFHWGYDFSGEIIINPIPELGIAIGAGYSQVSKESSVKVYGFFLSEEISVVPKITVIPITLGIYFTPPLAPGVNLVLSAGAGYYIGKLSWERGYSGFLSEYTDTFEGSKGTIGFQGSLGFEFEFSPKVAFVIEGVGRYAKLKEMKGDYSREGSSLLGPIDISGEYTLWYYEFLIGSEYYPRTHFFEEEPYDPPYYRNVRKAEIDLSGFSLKAGFKFRF
jgi:hypothetical protein